MMFMIPFLIFVLTFLYLYLSPIQNDQAPVGVGVWMNTVLESLEAIAPGDRTSRIKQDVELIYKIVEGIENDKIACIIPTKDEIRKLKNNTKIVFPDSAAFGGDAIVGTENIIKQKNPLLEIVKEKERRINESLNAIQLDLDVKGDKFKTRFIKKSIVLKNEIDVMKNKVVSGCSRQKIRLKISHPHLSNYEFINENVFNDSISPSNYVHGNSLIPVGRDNKIEDSKLGLMQELYSLD